MAKDLRQALRENREWVDKNCPDATSEEKEEQEKRIYSEWAKEVVTELSDAYNVLSFSHTEAVSEALINELTRQHRTLQQSIFCGLVVNLILKCAELKKQGWVDLRCEFSYDLAEKFAKVLEDAGYLIPGKMFRGPCI